MIDTNFDPPNKYIPSKLIPDPITFEFEGSTWRIEEVEVATPPPCRVSSEIELETYFGRAEADEILKQMPNGRIPRHGITIVGGMERLELRAVRVRRPEVVPFE